jgi:hypothetical protein
MYIFKLRSLNQVQVHKKPIKSHGHCNGNHKAKLVGMTPKLVHPTVHRPSNSIMANYHKDFQIMFLFTIYGGMMPFSPLTRKKLSMVGFLNMWNFGRWGCERMKRMPKSLVRTWFIGKTSLSCYQIFCPFKIQPFWKVFGL